MDTNNAEKIRDALLQGKIEPGDVPDEQVPEVLKLFARDKKLTGAATKTIKAFEGYVKKQIEAGVEYDGFYLKPGSVARVFNNLPGLHKKLAADYGCDSDTFRKYCSIATSGVEEIVKAGLPPGTPPMVIAQHINELCKEFGTTKQNAPTLKEI
jgi:hypothetical protein